MGLMRMGLMRMAPEMDKTHSNAMHA
jgi:hypothetical protein